MAEQNPLKPLFADIAEAIREKESSSLPIVAEDFPERIRNLPTGTELPDDLCTITVITNNASAGTVEGSCIASKGATITVKATVINQEFQLQGWFDGETELSASEEYTFVVTESRTLVARFKEPDIVLPAGYTALYYLDFPVISAYRYAKLSMPLCKKINNKYVTLRSKCKFSLYDDPGSSTNSKYLFYYNQLVTGSSGYTRNYSAYLYWYSSKNAHVMRGLFGRTPAGNTNNLVTMYLGPEWSSIDTEAVHEMLIYYFEGENINSLFDGDAYSKKIASLNWTSADTSNVDFLLFGNGKTTSTSYKYNFNGRIYRMTFYFWNELTSKDEVIHDLVPVRRDSDGVCGLYDVINNQFYTSLGEPFIGA